MVAGQPELDVTQVGPRESGVPEIAERQVGAYEARVPAGSVVEVSVPEVSLVEACLVEVGPCKVDPVPKHTGEISCFELGFEEVGRAATRVTQDDSPSRGSPENCAVESCTSQVRFDEDAIRHPLAAEIEPREVHLVEGNRWPGRSVLGRLSGWFNLTGDLRRREAKRSPPRQSRPGVIRPAGWPAVSGAPWPPPPRFFRLHSESCPATRRERRSGRRRGVSRCRGRHR